MSDHRIINAHQTIDEDSGVVYDGAVCHDSGAVGLRAIHPNGKVEFIMLNPSGGSDDGVPTVFVYIDEREPALINAVHHYIMFDEEYDDE